MVKAKDFHLLAITVKNQAEALYNNQIASILDSGLNVKVGSADSVEDLMQDVDWEPMINAVGLETATQLMYIGTIKTVEDVDVFTYKESWSRISFAVTKDGVFLDRIGNKYFIARDQEFKKDMYLKPSKLQ